MPVSNSPDKFFISNFDFTVLKELNQMVLNELLAMNPIQSGVFDKHTLLRLAKILAIHSAIKSENIFTQSIFNDRVKAMHEQFKSDNELIQENTKAEYEETKLNYQAKVDTYVSKINELVNGYVFEYGDHNDIMGKLTIPKTLNTYDNTPILPKQAFPKINAKMPDLSNVMKDYVNAGRISPYKKKGTNGAISDLTTNGGTPIYRGWTIKTKDGYVPDPLKTYTFDKPASQINKPLIDAFYNNNITAPPGAVRFFIEKLHGAYSDFKPYKKNSLKSTKSGNSKDNLSNRAVFAAYIDTFNDTTNVTTGSNIFIGASEPTYTYEQTVRSLTLSFSIISDYSLEMMLAMDEIYKALNIENALSLQLERVQELAEIDKGLGYYPGKSYFDYSTLYADTPETLWKKITFLQQCCYPYYRLDGKMKEMPFVRIRLGDYYDLNGIIESLSIDSADYDNQLDLNPSNLGAIPFSVKVTLSIKVVHDAEPSSTFWGFYHRKEFDDKSANPQTGAGLFNKQSDFGDPNVRLEDNPNKTPNAGSIPDKDLPQRKEIEMLGSELFGLKGAFNKKYKEFKSLATTMDFKDIKNKIKEQMSITLRIGNITQQLKNLYGLTSKLDLSSVSGVVKTLGINEIKGIQDIKNMYHEVEKVYGGVNANLNQLNDKLRQGNQLLKKVGINIEKIDEVGNVINNVNKFRVRNLLPKTLGDLLNK